MKNLLRLSLALLFTVFTLSNIQAQTDTEFWFAAPEVSVTHGDNPIYLRMSAQSQEANVLISIPANPAFAPIGITIPADSSWTLDLTPYKALLENIPANTVLDRGLYVHSNNPITVYYEVSAPNNPDIFPLKGSNAKGTHFYTPFQNFFDNGVFAVQPYASFDIVATEDNTTVTITPSVAINSHPAGIPFTISLNRGETYSCRAAGITAADHPTGSEISSNRPICVTIKDDSMTNDSCRDLWGDQIIPVELVGKQYIVMRGFLVTDEYAFILATEDATDVFVAGNPTPVATINTGQQYMYAIPTGQSTTYIETSKPSYVLHISGFGCEVGGAVLPPIQCTGSEAVYFTRATSDLFGLNIMTRSGSEGNFILNGSSTLVPASAFQPVPGTSNNWVAAQISFSTTDVPPGETSILVNTSSTSNLFHLGMIDGGSATGCRYGYFSDFSSANLGGNRLVCLGDTLNLDAGANMDSYQWSTGATTQQINVIFPGEYFVTTTYNGCTSSDTITVLNDTSRVRFDNDFIIVCGSNDVYLNAHTGFITYEWMDLSSNNDSLLYVNTEGTYWVEVMSLGGCYSRDTMSVEFGVVPPMLTVQATTPICEGDELTLTATGATYPVTWDGINFFHADGAVQTIPSASLLADGFYNAYQDNGQCKSPLAFIEVNIIPLPNPIILGDTVLCEGEDTQLSISNGPFDDFTWSTSETTVSVTALPGTYSVNATKDGCSRSVSATVHLAEPIANFTTAPNYYVFLGNEFQFSDSSLASPYSQNVTYNWDFEDGDFASGATTNHLYADTGTYAVMLVVTNLEGCIDTTYESVLVVKDVVVPNAFSPNGDGINDVFKIANLNLFENSKLLIFNRWGNELYSSDNYKNDWDGDDAPAGTYFYILDIGKGVSPFKGTFLMVK